MSTERMQIVTRVRSDTVQVLPHTYGNGVSLLITQPDGGVTSIAWGSTADALHDAARIIAAVAEHHFE